MKFSTYDPTVKTNNIQGEIRIPSDRAAWGISTNSLDDAGKAFRSIGLAIGQRQEEADRQTILKAMNLYNQGQYGLMYNAEDGLMNTKLEGSDGIDGTYLSRERELRNKVLGVTKLHDKKNMLALTNLMDKSAMQGFQAVDRHRQQQHEKVLDINLENNVQALIAKTIKDPSAIEDAMTQMGLLTSLRYQGQGKEILDAVQRQQGTRIVSAVLNNELQKENYAGARETLNSWGHCLDAKQLAAYGHAIQVQERAKAEAQQAKELVDKYGSDLLSIKNELDGQAISEASKRRILSNADTEISFREKARRRAEDAAYNAVESKIFDMYKSGESLANAEAYARQAAGWDGKALNRNLDIVKNLYGAFGGNKSGTNGLKMPNADFVYMQDVLLAKHVFKTKDDLMDYLRLKNANGEQILKASKLYDQAARGEGQYAWTEIKLDELRDSLDDGNVIKGLQDMTKKEKRNINWEYKKKYARRRIAEYVADHSGAVPTITEVRGFLAEAGTVKAITPEEGPYSFEPVEASPAQLLSVGIATATSLSDVGYLYDVRFTTGRERRLLTKGQLREILDTGYQDFLDSSSNSEQIAEWENY